MGGWARVGHCCWLRKGRRRREGIGRVSCAWLCRNLFQIVQSMQGVNRHETPCLEFISGALNGHETQGLELISGAMSFQNLREISRLIGRDLKGLHQDPILGGEPALARLAAAQRVTVPADACG